MFLLSLQTFLSFLKQIFVCWESVRLSVLSWPEERAAFFAFSLLHKHKQRASSGRSQQASCLVLLVPPTHSHTHRHFNFSPFLSLLIKNKKFRLSFSGVPLLYQREINVFKCLSVIMRKTWPWRRRLLLTKFRRA